MIQTISQNAPPRKYWHLGRIACLGIALFLLSTCNARTANAVTITINTIMPQTFFEPSSVTIKQGTEIVWLNKGAFVATVSYNPDADNAGALLPEGAEAWDSGDIYTGETFSYVFNTPGVYIYFSESDAGNKAYGLIDVVAD
ncbi:hypothetical protein G4Y79_18880 [Phototrophicus methaneseepsis]|uniref:Blue (type 1) copper domain-containing protein n=1 Tax=Phototrophicus methaneseepsis TaxID=2710758 RepID=A0A7S8IDN9_9CHLR|nr:hypothetical protein [Phototrophicus methaneseepsis]QPC81736.1 hypothetical protein G4Y79_18880 [Phototrophicus methaneseepsis]